MTIIETEPIEILSGKSTCFFPTGKNPMHLLEVLYQCDKHSVLHRQSIDSKQKQMFLCDDGPMIKTLDYTICIGSTVHRPFYILVFISVTHCVYNFLPIL